MVDISVDDNWYEGFTKLGITQGTEQYKIQNKGTGVLIIQFTESQPDPDDNDGLNLYQGESFLLPLNVTGFYIRSVSYSCIVSVTKSSNFEDFSTLPSDIFTSAEYGVRRLQVDVSQTGFWEGREFRFDLEITSPIVVKFSSPVNFILQSQTLESRDGLATFTAYVGTDGTSGGTFSSDGIVNLPNNAMTDTPPYTKQITITAGGTFTPNGNAVPRELIKVKAATATAQRQTVGGVAIQERGLPAGDYYLMFTGTDATYNLVYEERP